MTDALGNELIMGNKYGYSSRDGSWVTTGIGILEAIGASRVTLRIIEHRTFLNGKQTDRGWTSKPAISVQSCILFPLKD